LLESGDFDQANWWFPEYVPFLENGGGTTTASTSQVRLAARRAR
jgi:hypothetical protein